MITDLTILIPTWDRPQEVNQRLQEINVLWKGAVAVKVQVNPGRFTYSDIDTSLYQGPIQISQNQQNIGLFANVVCGLYGINTKWLWILGDDDSLRPEAPQLIEDALQTSEKEDVGAVLFNQWNQAGHQQQTICKDLRTFTQATGYGNALFFSGSIWKTSFFQSNLGVFLEYSNSLSSQILIYLTALHDHSSTILVVDQPLINYDYAHRWDRVSYLRRVFFLFHHPSVWSEREEVMTFLWPQCRWALMSAAHEQLKRGDTTLLEWLQVAMEVGRYQLLCAPPAKALGRIREIWSILLAVYPLSKLFRTFAGRLRRSLLGQQPILTTNPQRDVGL